MKASPLALSAVLALSFIGGNFNALAQQQAGAVTQSSCATGNPCSPLSAHAEQVAVILGIKPLAERAMALRH